MYPLLTSVSAQFLDECGKPVVGGKVYTYEANTTTQKKTFADPDGNAPNENPITLDQAGRAKIYLEEGAYRVRVVSQKGVLVVDTNKLSRYVTNTELAEFMSSVEDSLLELEKAKEAMNVMAQQVITESKDVPSGIAGLDDEAIIFPEQMPEYSKLGLSKYRDVKASRAINTIYTNDKDVGIFVSIVFSAYGAGFVANLLCGNTEKKVISATKDGSTSSSTVVGGLACSGFIPPKTEYTLHVESGARDITAWVETEI